MNSLTREDFGLEAHEPTEIPDTRMATVKEMSREERPRERAMMFGIQSLTTSELLAIILRTGQQGLPITDLCRQLMSDNNNSLLRLEQRSREELMLTRGIGEAKALQVEAMMEIVRRYRREALERESKQFDIIRTARNIFDLMRHRIANLDHEEIWILLLNKRNQVIKELRITSGGTGASVFDTKMIMKRALLENAEGIAMIHNHPSGNLKPSAQDDNITRKLLEACRAMDIRMIDHVIISNDGFFSYTDEGRISYIQ